MNASNATVRTLIAAAMAIASMSAAAVNGTNGTDYNGTGNTGGSNGSTVQGVSAIGAPVASGVESAPRFELRTLQLPGSGNGRDGSQTPISANTSRAILKLSIAAGMPQ